MKQKLILSVFILLLGILYAEADILEVVPEAGKTYSYDLANGSEMPQVTDTKYSTFSTADGLVTIKNNSGNQFWFHDVTHGGVFYNNNSIEFLVAGNATITFITCKYSADNAVFEFKDENNTVLGSVEAENNGGDDAFPTKFSYAGPAGKITARLVAGGAVYIHGLLIENAPEITVSNGLIDVWDFGAEQLDNSIYNNLLNETVINSWYNASIVVGSGGNTLPNFNAGVLSWIGGGNDRLRTTNTNLTRYDENTSGVEGYSGRVYVNSGASKSRYMSLELSEDDEVTVMALSQSGGGLLNFEFVSNPAAQTDVFAVGNGITEVKYVAKKAGTYHIFDTQDKPSYYRIYRKDALYVNLTGSVDVSNAKNIPDEYAIVFKNKAGKTWESSITDGKYNVKVPAGYTYELSLANANGYIIGNGSILDVTAETTAYDISVVKVDLYTVSGSINGLGSDISKLKLMYTVDPSTNKIFVPEVSINATTASYSVELEPNCEYTISAKGVNDFFIPLNKIVIGASNQTTDVVFEAKPLYKVTIDATGLNAEQLSKMVLTFTNLYEDGYSYKFTSVNDIALRDGTYTINHSGLDDYAVIMGLTSNHTVAGAVSSKTLVFTPILNWTFDDKDIKSGTKVYNGLIFTGTVSNEKAKGHLVTKAGDTIKIPVNVGDKIQVTYYYTANFSIEGGAAFKTESKSTSTLEYANYTYTGKDAGYVTITIGSGVSTSYITNIAIGGSIEYQPELYVGADKEYKTINEALRDVKNMIRGNNDRVTIMIDPGNYEEMLVIDMPNVTLKNAAAVPSIALANKGIDIDPSAVRITSYYGTGYDYYSMNNQKWDGEVLRVNKENGYLSSRNKGDGTTNNSYWNATVVVFANGFEAEDIIFENSFNQYISKKESEDIVVMWESGSKGLRPTNAGNTDVQKKSFVERAAAIAIANNTDKVILNKCRVVGHQDTFFGGVNSRVVVYKGVVMGGTDYLFGGMTAVFYKTDIEMNTSDDKGDISYLTAAQQSGGRGYLMYECTVKSATPGIDNASTYLSKPGYFGRPWQATTSEVVFYNTTIETTNYTGLEGKSLIEPIGWDKSLGGESKLMYEYGTIEESGANNQANRATWATVLKKPTLNDGTEITTYNFTKGTDGWDPISELVANDESNQYLIVDNLLVGKVDSPEDYTCKLKIDWNTDNVHLFLDITDDSIVSTGTSYQVDNIEVYFDMDNSKNIKWPRNGGWMSADPTYDANDFQLRLVPGVEFSVNNSVKGITQVYNVTENGYRFELTIPWSSLLTGFVPAVGTQIGFDILASDNDAVASDANRNQLTLVSSTPNPYNDPSLFGTLQFEDLGDFSLIADTEVPGIVSGLTAKTDKSSVTLTWENASDNIAILYYNVYQGAELLPNKVYPKETGNSLIINDLEDGDYTFYLETVDNSGNVSENKASVGVNITTVSANYLSSLLTFYPNPVVNILHIKGIEKIEKVEVVGLNGNVLKSNMGVDNIDLSGLSKGVYILKVQNVYEVVTTKFLKN